MEEDIQYYLPTIMFHGTPCIIQRVYCIFDWPNLHTTFTFFINLQINGDIGKFVQFPVF